VGKGTELLGIREHHLGSFNGFCLFQVRLPARYFSAVELNLLVRSIAKRFLCRLTATAECILRLCGVCLPFSVFKGFANDFINPWARSKTND
jgi:hypothetical protein